ncbi:MAG: hypothetical protein GOV15_00110 [Candidatus Diapherotrites archaeon]|nr:hypothetical protein [Candidatus Diapherotrites archaeon]
MAIKNFWSLEPGEAIVADKIRQNLKAEVFFPVKGVHFDLAFLSNSEKGNRKVKTVQVKTSRQYPKGAFWFTIKESNLKTKAVDYFILLCYKESILKRKTQFKKQFIIIPRQDLLKKAKFKKKAPGAKYHFQPAIEGKTAVDLRPKKSAQGRNTDYSKYLNNWNLLK